MIQPDVQGQEQAFLFGPFKLLPRRQLLLRGEHAIKLSCRAAQVLSELVRNAGQVVSKNALLETVWSGQFVHESNLKVHIRSLRRALDETRPQPSYIATVAGRGYRFIPIVTMESIALPEVPNDDPPISQSLPPRKTLIGRDREIERIANALAENTVVTLVGSGGVGKTTIAVSVAHDSRSRFTDGVCFIDLTTTHDSARVPDMLAAALGLRGNPPDPVDAIVEHLKQRRVLVVLDNCEHVLPSAAMLATRLQKSGTRACLLATSREPLGLTVENVQPIGPLAVPPKSSVTTVPEAMRYPAVELFVTRALEWADYQFVDSDASGVASICSALDGLPLAIELAASNVGPCSVTEIVETLATNFATLRRLNGPAHSRHHTLWATFDWSYCRLCADEAIIFQLTSVFAGPFELNDVIAMTRVLGYDLYRTSVGLGCLVQKSLVAAESDENALRYRLLDCARSYAAEKLNEGVLEPEANRSHARLMLALFERSEQEWNWHEARAWTRRYQNRLPDLRKALDWCFSAAGDGALGTRLTAAAIPLWDELSAVPEALSRVGRALEHRPLATEDLQCRAKLCVSWAWSMTLAGRPVAETAKAWQVAIECAARNDEVGLQLRALGGYSLFLVYTGSYELALRQIDRYRRLAVEHGDVAALPNGQRLRALVEACSGQLISARDRLESIASKHSDHIPRARIARFQAEQFVATHGTLAFVEWLTGDPARASRTAEIAVEHASKLGHLLSLSNALGLAALPIALWNGDHAALRRYAAQLKTTLGIENIASWLPAQRFFEASLAHARGHSRSIVEMQAAVDEMLGGRFFARTPMYLGMLAEALIETKDVSAADRVMAQALRQQERSREAWYLPELMRINAKLLQAGKARDHEHMLREALAKASATGARSFELRIASDLASHWLEDGRFDAAESLLRPIFDRFTEGHQYKDLQRAASLLATIQTSAASSRVVSSNAEARSKSLVPCPSVNVA